MASSLRPRISIDYKVLNEGEFLIERKVRASCKVPVLEETYYVDRLIWRRKQKHSNLVDDALARHEGDDARSMSDRNLPYPIKETGNSDTVGNPQTREECNDPAELPTTNQESACGCAAGGEIAQLGRVADTRKSDPTEHDEMIRSLTSYPCSSYTQMPRSNTERPKRDSEAFVSSIGPADQQFMAAQGNTRKASPNMNIPAPEPAGSGATMPDHEPSIDESTEASPNMNILTIEPDDLGATMPGPGPRTDVSTEDSLQKTQHVTDV